MGEVSKQCVMLLSILVCVLGLSGGVMTVKSQAFVACFAFSSAYVMDVEHFLGWSGCLL